MGYQAGGVAETAAHVQGVTSESDPEWRLRLQPQRPERLVPFLPARSGPPVMLLAIPRCGAGSIALFLERLYGPEGVVRDAGVRVNDIFARRAQPVVSDCLVVGLPLVRWQQFCGSAEFQRMTVLRNPWARIVSHINRLGEIGPERAGPAGSASRALAEEVARTDFTSRSGVERFVNRLRLIDVSFDDIQVRMLLTSTMSALVKQVLPRDVEAALRELERFALVGFCEDQLDMQRALLRLTGRQAPVGALFEGGGRGSVLSPRNAIAREVLLPLYELDQELYSRARAAFGPRSA